MKRMLILLLTLCLLCGCSGLTETATTATLPTATEAEETPVIPNVMEDLQSFTLAYLPDYGTNPLECSATVNRELFSLLYEALFVVNNQFEAEPLLCESFTVSADNMSYYFYIYDDILFTDGTPLTAYDVVASITAARSSRFYRGRLSHVTYSAVQEDGSVLVQLDTPYENFALMMDIPILKEGTMERLNPVGTGSYYLVGNRLVRSKHWWQDQEPIVAADEIPLVSCETSIDVCDEFQFGDTNLVYCDPNAASSGGYRCDYEIWEVPTTVMQYLAFNMTSGYFTNKELRTAVTYAVDRETIAADCYSGFATPSTLPCSPSSDLYDVALSEEYRYAPERFAAAAEFVGVQTSAAYDGYAGTLLVCNEEPARVKAAEIIAQSLRDAGLNITVVSVNYNTFLLRLAEKKYDLYLGETRLTADFCLKQFFTEYGYLQYGGMTDESLVSMCVSAHANSGNYYDLCRQVMEKGALCPVSFKSYAVYVTRGKIASLAPAVDCVFHTSEGARTLADADKTYAVDEPEETDALPEESTDAASAATEDEDT